MDFYAELVVEKNPDEASNIGIIPHLKSTEIEFRIRMGMALGTLESTH